MVFVSLFVISTSILSLVILSSIKSNQSESRGSRENMNAFCVCEAAVSAAVLEWQALRRRELRRMVVISSAAHLAVVGFFVVGPSLRPRPSGDLFQTPGGHPDLRSLDSGVPQPLGPPELLARLR